MRFSLTREERTYAASNAYFKFDSNGWSASRYLYTTWTQPLSNLIVNASGHADWALSSQFGLMVMDTETLNLCVN
jgi:hypothetical protein